MAGIDLTKITAAVEKAKGTNASAKTLIEGIIDRIRVAVEAALTADENADQASIDAANAAIDAVAAELTASSDELGAAVVANS